MVDSVPFLYAGLALAAAGLALIAVWSRRATLWKSASVGLLVALLVLGYFAYVGLLSKPKPLRLEFAELRDSEVISAVLEEDEAIYLWLSVAGRPRYYEMPWDKELALELQTVMREARRSGEGVAMRIPEEPPERGPEEGPEESGEVSTFYAVPPPIIPPEKEPIVVRNPQRRL